VKTFVFDFESRFAVAGVWFAIDNQREDAVFAPEFLECLNFLADPPRLRRAW